MSDLPLLPKATAVWLVDNTTLTFTQIAAFTGMHDLEIAGVADGEVAIGIKGLDPVQKGQLTREEITRCETDPSARLKLIKKQLAPPQKRKAPRYTPLSKRQDRPAAIAWLALKEVPGKNAIQASIVAIAGVCMMMGLTSEGHWIGDALAL